MLMEITQRDAGPDAAVVSLAGRIMMGPLSEQIVTVAEDLLRQGKRTIIFDLSAVTSIDSTGIGRFISSFNKIMAVGGEMRMAGATGHLFDAFHVSLLDTVFPFYESVEEASK